MKNVGCPMTDVIPHQFVKDRFNRRKEVGI
jgi:hypothetical protein